MSIVDCTSRFTLLESLGLPALWWLSGCLMPPSVAPRACGDGMVDSVLGEECDDGGESATCDRDCTPAGCGDGVTNAAAGEQCDDRGPSATCNGDCTAVTSSACGNLAVEPLAGEECDDGNADDSDWCLASCRSASCNDGILNADEVSVDCGGHCGVSCLQDTAASLFAGGAHTCMLMESGAVRCWGYNKYGQLGYGTTSNIGDDETPAASREVDVGERVAQLAAGGYHTCALMESGAVRCWGWNFAGQLGYGHTSNMGDNEAPAGGVDVGGVVVQLVAG